MSAFICTDIEDNFCESKLRENPLAAHNRFACKLSQEVINDDGQRTDSINWRRRLCFL